MKEIIPKEELEEIKKLKGEARGMGFKNNMEFVFKEEGKEGLKRLENKMRELGYPIEYKKVKTMDFYPLSLEALLLLVAQRLFNYDSRKFQEMGRFGAKSSLIIRLFMKYFISIEKILDKPPQMWRKYFTVGDMKVVDFNEEKKHVILRLENFRLNLPHCQLITGFLSALIKMMVNSETTSKELKCPFKGDEYHEFLIKWE